MQARISILSTLLGAMLAWPLVAAVSPGKALIDAIRAGEEAEALRLINEGADVNDYTSDGTRPLHWAAHNEMAFMVDKLLAAGADPTVINAYGATPMSEAAVTMNRGIIEKLLDAGAGVDSPNQEGQTVLMLVARNSDVDLARMLIERGANVNAVEQFRQQTPLMLAAADAHPAMVKLLVDSGANVNARSAVNNWARQVTAEPRAIHRPAGGLTPLLYAAREGCVLCAQYLAEGGADLNMADPEGLTPLIMSIWNAHWDTAKYLLEAGANPNKWDWWGRTPLYLAVDYNTLPHGGRADKPSLDQTTALDIIKMLLDAGVNPNPRLKLFPPYRATGNDRGLDRMIHIGMTPLLRASKALDADAVKLLLDHGARVDLPNRFGDLPITAAAGVGSTDADTRGWYITPDTQQRAIATLQLLLDAGADINTKGGRRQMTALHGAARWGWNDVIQFLVAHGADVNATDSNGMNPADAAMGRSGGNSRGEQRIDYFPETAQLLISLGTKMPGRGIIPPE